MCVKLPKPGKTGKDKMIEIGIVRGYPCEESPIVINITRLTQPVERSATKKKPR